MRVHTLTLDPFHVYLAMGPQRSVRLLAERCGIPETQLTLLAIDDRWEERLANPDAELRDMNLGR